MPSMLLAAALLVGCQTGQENLAPRIASADEQSQNSVKPVSESETARIEDLDQRFVSGQYHVYYTNEGPNAFGLPGDPAEGLRKARQLVDQLQRGRDFYENDLGLHFLLGRGRFEQQSHIDIRVAALPRRIMGNAGSGRFEINRNPIYYPADKPAKPGLRVSISTRWKHGNVTPEHEMFHLFQYGYSFIANPWYLEGLTGAMAPVFDLKNGQHIYTSAPLPATNTELANLLAPAQLDVAWKFWRRLMLQCDASCPVIQNGDTYTVTEGRMCGKKLIGQFMRELQRNEIAAIKHRGRYYDPWTRTRASRLAGGPSERGRFENNYWLLKAVGKAMEVSCNHGDKIEARSFYHLIKNVTQNSEDDFTKTIQTTRPDTTIQK